MTQYLILLALIPVCCFELTKLLNCKHRRMCCGISVGLVIAPVSYALLEFTYVPVLGKLLGLVGMLANMTHGPVGYLCLVGSGVLEPGVQLAAMQLLLINLVNGMFFAYVYGVAGYFVDRKQMQKSVVRRVIFS